ncbi:hypothetical protein HD806DRAFT_532260 [Xylariaceae sp. AK1471]|nr:hypothetical protein HD806DRAFT_532260 [Xylariaceae sp. AK1471]
MTIDRSNDYNQSIDLDIDRLAKLCSISMPRSIDAHLCVFDSSDRKGKQTATADQENRALWTYLPQSSNGSILITTRDKELASRLTGDRNNLIELGGQPDAYTATELVEVLEYMPLSISQASAYVRKKAPRTSAKKYLDEFRKKSLVRPLDQNKGYDREEGTDNESMNSNEALDDAFEGDVVILRDYCLVNTNEEGDVFEMHGLVQLSTRKWLDARGETGKFKKQYISRMAQVFPTGDFRNWETCQKLFSHAERATYYRPDDEESLREWALLLCNGSCYSLQQGKYTLAETMSKQSQDTRRVLLGPEHPDTLNSMANLAFIWNSQGRDHDAFKLIEQCFHARIRVLGPEHPDAQSLLLTIQNWHIGESQLRERR